MPVFVSHAKQVSFVVIVLVAVRGQEKSAVDIPCAGGIVEGDEASCQSYSVKVCPLFCRSDDFPLQRLGQCFGMHAETCGESFGQDNDIRLSAKVFQVLAKPAEVGGFVFPFNVRLQQGYTQGVAHMAK